MKITRVPLLLLLVASQCFALGSYSPTNLSALTDSYVNSLVQTAAIGSSYHPMEPATPLGLLIGLDIGVDVTAISLPADFQNALATASGQSVGSIPALFPLPKFSVHKGLPFGVDLGFGGVSYQDKFKLYGGDVKWAFIRDKSPVSVAVRQTMSYSKLYYLSSHSYDTQVLVSKNLTVVDPYFGAGYLFWNGDIDGSGLPVGINGHRSGNDPHVFVGIPLKLLALRITAEYDYNFAKISTYGARIGFGL